LRVLVLEEGPLAGSASSARLREAAGASPGIEPIFEAVAPSTRFRRTRRSLRVRRALKRNAGEIDVAFVHTLGPAPLIDWPRPRVPCVCAVAPTADELAPEEVLERLRAAAAQSPTNGGRRMKRRTVLVLGTGAIGAAVVAPYAPLPVDDEFEQLVGSRLGVEPWLARDLLSRARARYGAAEYDLRAFAFALAVRDPAATVMPTSFRRRAILGLLEPMLSTPDAARAYETTGVLPSSPACAGLLRDR
jgi:hypothetical protein